MLIFLIGFMGSGKSYIGKRLAEQIAYDFIDLDTYIVDSEKLTINDIFQKEGEHAFRSKENSCLKTLLEKKNTIIATGGGTPCFYDNMDLMCKNGITIYLYANNNILFARLKKEREKRPLIANTTDEALMNIIQTKIAERSPTYEQAEAIFEIKNLEDDKIINDIYNFLTFYDDEITNK
jgi:shikimate kinase